MLGRSKVAVVSAAALLLTACADSADEEGRTSDEPSAVASSEQPGAEASGSQEPMDAEAGGGVRGQSGRLRVAVPEGWQEETLSDQLFSLRYVQTPGDPDSVTVSLAGEFGPYDTARVGLSTLVAEVQVGTPGFSVEETTDIDVPGATSAVRLDFVYGTEEDGGTFEGMWIVASDADTDESVAVAVSGPTVEDSLLEEAQDSMTMLEP